MPLSFVVIHAYFVVQICKLKSCKHFDVMRLGESLFLPIYFIGLTALWVFIGKFR